LTFSLKAGFGDGIMNQPAVATTLEIVMRA